MRSHQFARSTGYLAWGTVLLVLGQALWSSGRRTALLDSVTGKSLLVGHSSGQGATVVGALAALVGLAMLVLGIVRLSRNVDLAAQEAARVMAEREASTPGAQTAGRITRWQHPEDWDETATDD